MDLKRSVKWIDFSSAVFVWGVVEFVTVQLVPGFVGIFGQSGGQLSASARFVIRFGGVLGSLVIPMVLVGIVVFQCWRMGVLSASSSEDMKRPWDNKVMLAALLLGTVAFLFLAVALWVPVYGIGGDYLK